MTYTIQLRRDTAANWTAKNDILASGELGVETDTHFAKMGDGSTAWNSLPYWQPSADSDNFDPAGAATTAQNNAETFAQNLVNALPAGLKLVASTLVAGYNFTAPGGNVLTWTSPNDGAQHYVHAFGNLHASVAETGGAVNVNFTDPGGNSVGAVVDSGGHGIGSFTFNGKPIVVGPNTTVTLAQSAMSAGTVVMWAALWAV